MSDFYVLIIEDGTDEPVEELGPFSEREADRLAALMWGRIDTLHFSVEVREGAPE